MTKFQTISKLPKTTPWGEPQTTKVLAPGIILISTACHGGIWLNPERNAQVPSLLKENCLEQANDGWYEEDCDAQVVAQFFKLDLFA